MNQLVTVEHTDPHADVLIITNAWPHPGERRYGIFTKRQVDSLIEAGLRCDVLFIRGFESPWAYVVAAARLLRLSMGKRPRYRLVHGHGGETLLPCLLYRRGPRVISFCGDDLLATPGRRRVLRELARLTNATITKSREMHGMLPPSVRRRNRVVPNGVDRAFFRPMDRAEARRELGWAPDERVALYAADPDLPRKRYGLAAGACDRAERAGVPVRLRIAHTTPPALMPTVMNAADCLLMTSAREGSPNVVKEAVTIGLPVVATPVGDVRELLDGVHPSYVCEPNPDVLGWALVACMRDGSRSNGRDHCAWLDQRQIAKRVLDLYDSLV